MRVGSNMVPIIVATVALLALGLKPAAAADVSYYDVPRGAHPHDVAPAPDGTVWYTAQSQGALGILDPKTGKVTQIRLGQSGADSRFDPSAKAWKVWHVPKSKTGCYAVYVDDKDKVWLSDWVANEIMRFDPATEKFESYPSNKRGALVRQLQGRPGEIWGAESGTDRLVVVRD